MGGGGEEYPNHNNNHSNNHNHSSNRNNKHCHSSNHHSSRDSAMQSRRRSGSAAPFPQNVTVVEVVSCGCSSPSPSSLPSLYSSRRGSTTAGRIRSGLGGGNAAGEVSKIWPLFRNDHHHVNLLMLKHRRSSLNNKHPADALGAAAFRTKKPNSDAAAAAVASASIIKSPPPPLPLPPPPPSSSFFFQSSYPRRRPSFNGSSGRVNRNPWLASQRSSVSSNPETVSVTRADCDQGSVNTPVHARKKPAVHYHDDDHRHHHHLQLRDALYKEELADALEREFKKAGYLCNGRPKTNQTLLNHHYSFFGDEDAVVEMVQGEEEDWRDDYTAIDSPPRIDQHSSPAQYCTITRSDHELQADDCSRAELESVAHGAYSALKNLSRCLIATHCKRMKKTTNDSKWKSDDVDAVEEILGRLMPDAEFARPSHFKHGIEACLHRIVLEDFDTESYGVHHRVQGHFSSPCLRKASFLREFRLFEMHSAEKLIDAECDEFSSSFRSFCLRKRDAISVEIIDRPRGEEDAVAGMLNSESYQWPLKLLRVFLDAMRRVWMMHRLSFAMDPPAKIFRPFDDCNMEVLQIQFRKTTLSDYCIDGMEFRELKPYHCEEETAYVVQSDNGRLGKASGRKLELPEDLGHDNYIVEKAFAAEKEMCFSTQQKPYHCKKKAGFFPREAAGRGSEIYSDNLRDNYAEEASVVEKETEFSVHKPYHHERKAAFSACPEVRRIGQAVGSGLKYLVDLDEDDYGAEEEDTEFYAHEPYQCEKKAGLDRSEASEEHKMRSLNIEGIKPLPKYDDKMIDQGIKNLPKSGDKMIEGIKPLPKFGDQTIEGIKPLPKFNDKIMEPVHLDDAFTERMQFVVMPGFVLPHGDVLVKSKVYLQPWNGISPSKNISRFS